MGRDLAIDLGTANTLVYRQGEGVVFDEPAVVAVRADTGEVLAMGEEAWQMLGSDSGNVIAVRPLEQGTMTEFDITQAHDRGRDPAHDDRAVPATSGAGRRCRR